MAGNQYGSFLGTTNVWDVGDIYNIEKLDPKLQELLVRLYQNLNNMSLSVNTRDAGFYDNANEFVNGQVWFPNPANTSLTSSNPAQRQVYRLVINFGALPNTGVKTVPHNILINTGYTFTRIYATASDTTGLTYIPIPYASPTLANNIELSVSATNVIITTGSNRSNYNVCTLDKRKLGILCVRRGGNQYVSLLWNDLSFFDSVHCQSSQ